jgi:hypothetical protein
MTPKELEAKIMAAKATGLPLFLTEPELRWLREHLINQAESCRLPADKINLIYSVSIGMKCANTLEDFPA